MPPDTLTAKSRQDNALFSAVVTRYWNMFKQNIGIMIAVNQLADDVQNEFRLSDAEAITTLATIWKKTRYGSKEKSAWISLCQNTFQGCSPKWTPS